MKKNLLIKSMFLLCALIVGSGTMWAEEVTLWSEDFSSYSADDVPTGGTYSYVCGETSTKIYKEALAGRTAPELLVSKNGGTFTATVPLDNIEGDLTLTFYTNKQTIAVSTTTEGILGSLEEKSSGQHTLKFTGVKKDMTQIVIEFKGTSNSNVRLDDIVLVGTKASGGGDTPTTYKVTYNGNGATSGDVPTDATEYDDNSTVTVLGCGDLTKEHYSFTGWNTVAGGTGTGYVAGNTFTISANTTLYAQWTVNTNTVTLPESNKYGAYTMSTENPVAYGTEVTLTYTPAEGYENFKATWSVNGETIATNKFTMPDEAVNVTVKMAKIMDMTIDFESDATTYSDWTFTNITSKSQNNSVNVHGGSYMGITSDATASIQTREKVTPASLTCFVSKTTGNNTACTWTIQVSTDGNSWTDVNSISASSMSKGEWKELTADLSAYSDVYVRVYYGSNSAVRCIDDLTLVLRDINEPLISADDVSITADQTSGEISYTISNEPDPTGTLVASVPQGSWVVLSGVYASPISFTCDENTSFIARTAIVTLSYTYDEQTVTKEVIITQTGNPNAPGTENNPYTVAEARAAIDAGTGVKSVYATGIVSEIITPYSSEHGNISYNISADGSTTGDQLQAYRGKGLNGANFTSDDDIQVGDTVIIFGNLTKYKNTYEFEADNQLVSLGRPVVPSISAADLEIAFDTTTGEIEYTIVNEPSPVGVLSASVSEGTWLTVSVVGQKVEFSCSANEATAPRTAKVTLTYSYGDNKTATKEITITQAKHVTYGDWVQTDFADLTEDDVFVIVGDNSDTYAMLNNGTSAPDAVEVTVAGNTLSGEIADNLKWNLSGNATDGYTFYPNGTTESWLYCTNNNNGVRVGKGEANVFILKDDHLYNIGKERYVGIYNSQEWRCYTTIINSNIEGQSFSFYKKKSANVTLSASGYATYCSDKALDFTNIKKQNYRAWYVSNVTGTTVTFTEITGTVKAGEGIILYGTPGAKCSLPYAESGEELSGNMLRGTLTPTAITTVEGDYTNFGLSGGEFKKIASGTIPANKAYLPVLTSSLSSEARLSIVLNDGTTGVNDVRGNVKEISDSIFDLQGRKVSKPTKGLYIMNGKKVFVK